MLRSQVVDEERMRPFFHGVGAFCFFYCHDAVVWVTGSEGIRTIRITCSIHSKDSVPEPI